MTLGASLRSGSDRLMTAAIDCSWVFGVKPKRHAKYQESEADFLQRQATTDQIPLIFTMGAIPDAFNMIPAIAAHYDPARQRQARWTLGFEWDKAHKVGNSITLFAAWFQAMAQVRLDAHGELGLFHQQRVGG